ncbi:unnamed protein product [Phytophthora lilii]|uniref:Unnamed protein product n=1 Tax=Phytophthora lilii TaxID=2077276 RepID=A0A9W6TFR8_9STRA|nr:unnamed protein product [Phytophthora lilii]
MASSDEESIPHMEEENYSETTTPVPVGTLDEDEGHFSGEIGVKGELYFTLDKDEYRAGELVTGRITVLVSEPLQCGGECRLLEEEGAVGLI